MAVSIKLPTAPRGLSAEARTFWSTVNSEFTLDRTQLKILELCCEAIDQLRDAQCALREHGPLIAGLEGGAPRANPAAAMVRDTRAQILMCLKNLNLDIEPPVISRSGRKPRVMGD